MKNVRSCGTLKNSPLTFMINTIKLNLYIVKHGCTKTHVGSRLFAHAFDNTKFNSSIETELYIPFNRQSKI